MGKSQDSPTRTGCIRSCPTRPLTIWANEALVPSPVPCWREEEEGRILALSFPHTSLRFFSQILPHGNSPVYSPESPRLEAPQDGKAEPVEEWAGQSPPGLGLLGSLALAVLRVAEEKDRSELRAGSLATS